MTDSILTSETAGIKQRAVLVSLITPDSDEEATDKSLDELESLLDTAGGETAARITQNRNSPDIRTYVGKGKAEEIAEFIKNDGEINLAVFDNELTPSQINNLEKALGVRVIDRTMLILDIFALHAVTAEGKLQVEIACLKYTAPRLVGHGNEMSRLGGGIGTRGPGESQIETDRRHLKRRLDALNERLTELERSRDVLRKSREKYHMKTAAICGYTNAGKSTLLNYLTGAGVLSQDKLFATLDPTTRKLSLPEGEDILLTDTVGFIDRLPHHLVKAFKSTLDEVRFADVLVCLVDASECDTERCRKRKVTEDLVRELCGERGDIIWCYNKCDIAADEALIPNDAVRISAGTGEGVGELLEKLKKAMKAGKQILTFSFTHAQAADMYALMRNSVVISAEYTDDGALITAECEEEAANRYAGFVKKA